MVIASTNELLIAMITLIAIAPTNSPAGPGISAMGAKAKRRRDGRAEQRNGQMSHARAHRLRPAIPRRSFSVTSSTITIALSISRPRAMIKPVTDI